MINGGRGLGLTLEPLQRDWVAGQVFRKELQCNFALDPQVFCAINDAHAAGTKLLEDTVVRNDLVQDCRF
jgi:hypothetical protein